jgi:hypothetical protein
MNTVTMSEGQLVKTIKAHLAKADQCLVKAIQQDRKAEQHHIAAGQHLKTLKDMSPDQATFLEVVKAQIGLGKSRTYELLQIADGTKTVEDINSAAAERMREIRARPERSGQTAEDDTAPDHQSPWTAHGQPAPDDDDDVEFAPPEEITKNILDSIERQKAITLAYKKILKAPSLNREMEDEVSIALGGLITILQSLQRTLAAGRKHEVFAPSKKHEQGESTGAPDDPLEIPPMLDRTRGAA